MCNNKHIVVVVWCLHFFVNRAADACTTTYGGLAALLGHSYVAERSGKLKSGKVIVGALQVVYYWINRHMFSLVYSHCQM
jgi:hypothetical protein